MTDNDTDVSEQETPDPQEHQEQQEEQLFETTPEQATGMDSASPGFFNRKRVLIALCISFAVIIGGGLIISTLNSSKKKSSVSDEDAYAANSSSEFLSSLRDRAANRRQEPPQEPPEETKKENEPLLPPVSINRSPPAETVRYQPPPQQPAPASPPQGSSQQANTSHFRSSLVPPIQGSLFTQATQPPNVSQVARNASNGSAAVDYSAYAGAARAGPYGNSVSDYVAQNNQQNKQSFFDSSNSGGFAFNGQYLGDNSVWTGTVIPGILETAINTDLPGNVLARVTQNVYDSRNGRTLLIPQGTLLLARYNSSVSYQQHRVQIVWDTLIRPDGFQLDLEGANGVDKAGMSGQIANYSENWFEYLKAAGIITMFSVATAKMTNAAAQYAVTENSAGNIAEANSQFVDQVAGNMVNRAMNIQPTLTVENGTLINIMLNNTLYLPPVAVYPATQKYILE